MGSRILVFGQMGSIGESVSTRLTSFGYDVTFVPFAQNVFRDYFGYSRLLTKTVRALMPEYVIPVGDMLAAARLKDTLENDSIAGSGAALKICTGSETHISLLDRKTGLYSLASSLGILQPELLDNYDDIDDWMNVVFKRDISFGGHGVHRPRSREALDNLINHQSPGEPFLVERFVNGTQWSVDVVRCPSFCRASSYRCLSSQGCGPALQRVVEHNCTLEDIAVRLLDHLDFRGVCGFDFIVTDDGVPYLLETNPRLTGGIDVQIASGFDIPSLLLKAFSD